MSESKFPHQLTVARWQNPKGDFESKCKCTCTNNTKTNSIFITEYKVLLPLHEVIFNKGDFITIKKDGEEIKGSIIFSGIDGENAVISFEHRSLKKNKTNVIFIIIMYTLIFGAIGAIFGLFDWDSFWKVVSISVVIGFLVGLLITSDSDEKRVEKETLRKINVERMADEKTAYRELIENQYGKPIITRNSFNSRNTFSVHEESKVILINQEPILYSNIRACELLIDSQTSTSSTSTITKSSTGSVLGRAVVGTVIAGGAGAVIGGLSGKKTGIGETTTNTVTKYLVRISTNDITVPSKIYKCNDDIEFATNLVDTLNIIIERPDKNEAPSKIVNSQTSIYLDTVKVSDSKEEHSVVEVKLVSKELSKLQKLKESGVISDEEFMAKYREILK